LAVPRALPLALAALACGPISATSVIGDAEVALARAHAAESEKYAPYETTLADLYLVKAREEQGHAHYSEASQLAADAVKYASAATKKAAESRAGTATPPTPTANIQRPVAPPAAPAPAQTAPPTQPPPPAKQP
jgi:hypothetical protein